MCFQEVELSNIVKTLSLTDEGEVIHHVVVAINNLKTIHNADSLNDVIKSSEEIDIIRTECDKGIAYRILAAKNDAYSVVMSCFKRLRNSDEAKLRSALSALVSLTDGQPDLLDPADIPVFHEMFALHEKNSRIIVLLLKLNRNLCLRHEINRQAFIRSGIVTPLIDILKLHTATEVICECLTVLRIFTFDDDIRVPYGKAHDHAKLIASDFNALKLLSSLISSMYILFSE